LRISRAIRQRRVVASDLVGGDAVENVGVTAAQPIHHDQPVSY